MRIIRREQQAIDADPFDQGSQVPRLVVVGRPAAAARRVTAITADVNADGQPKLLGAGVNRPVAMAPERLVGAWRNIDLHVLAEFGAALDLGDRRLGIVLAD